ncbi:MAG: hypothetical protein K0U15_03120 [Proteobacteria bacterium]|nr:hypothetical protein [Pseudomonadota bacterium]MCH9757930.1 hypothetical protein [Pseudomonadota bacterium]
MSSGRRIGVFLRDSFTSGISIYWVLLRLTLPLLIIIRILDEHFDLIAHSGRLLAPLMHLVGLPGDAAIVFATALFLQIYASLLVLITLWAQLELTTAQVTVLMTMILIAHALPVELRITHRAGLPAKYALLLRLGSAFLLGGILNLIYGDSYLQQTASLPFEITSTATDNTWTTWALMQARNWAGIFLIVQVLVLFVNVLRVTHAEKLLIWLLAPPLRLLGIGEKAVTMTMIGMLLGLSYGGGLLIEESRKHDMKRRDVICTLVLLSICHSIFEDTLLVMLVGAHVSGVFFGRVIFSFLLMVLLNRTLRHTA